MDNNQTTVTIASNGGSFPFVLYVGGGDSKIPTQNIDIIYDAGTNGSTINSWDYTIDAGASVTKF